MALGAVACVWRIVSDIARKPDEPHFFEVIPVEAPERETAEVVEALSKPMATPSAKPPPCHLPVPCCKEKAAFADASEAAVADGPVVAEFGVDDSLVPREVAPPEPERQFALPPQPPSPKGTIRPVYPRSSRAKGESGHVTLEVFVTADGYAERAEVVASSGSETLDSAAVKAVKEAKYVPGTKDGRPIGAFTRLTFDFRLK